MTGILTKQNAIDKALVGGGGGGGDSITGQLNTLHVYHDSTFDGPTRFENIDGASVTFKTKPVFEQDLTSIVNGEPVSITDLCKMIDSWGKATKQVSDAVEMVDRRYNDIIKDVMLDLDNVSSSLEDYISKHPDIVVNDGTLLEEEEEENNSPSTLADTPTIQTREINLLTNPQKMILLKNFLKNQLITLNPRISLQHLIRY